MRTIGIITVWIGIAAGICALSSIDGFFAVIKIEGYLIQLLIPLMSLNMMVCTSTATSLFKYEENHELDERKVDALVSEMKQSVVAQLVGIGVVMLLKSASSLFTSCAFVFIYHTLSISVLVMFVWLIFDMSLAYFRLIKGLSN